MSLPDRVSELETALEDAIGYIIGCIGSSYCDTNDDDFEFLNELEEILGVDKTPKSAFY